jgi:hypothetical protein
MGRRTAAVWVAVLVVVLGVHGVSRTWERGTWDARSPEPRPQGVPAASVVARAAVPAPGAGAPQPCDQPVCGEREARVVLCAVARRADGGRVPAPPPPAPPPPLEPATAPTDVAGFCTGAGDDLAELRRRTLLGQPRVTDEAARRAAERQNLLRQGATP